MDMFFEQNRIGAEVDVFLTSHQSSDDLTNLRMQQRLAPRNGDHGGSTFVDRLETLFRGEVSTQDVGGILNFPAARAGQIAAKEWFQHQNQRISFDAPQLLAEDITCDSPHLRNRHTHSNNSVTRSS